MLTYLIFLTFFLNGTQVIKYVDKFTAQYPSDNNIPKLKKEIEYEVKSINDLTLVSEDGIKMSFEDFRKTLKGKVVYVDFWASWCAPCVRMIPESKKLHEKYKTSMF